MPNVRSRQSESRCHAACPTGTSSVSPTRFPQMQRLRPDAFTVTLPWKVPFSSIPQNRSLIAVSTNSSFFLLSHSLQSWNIVADVKCKAPTFSLSLFLLYIFVSRSLFNSKLFCEFQHLWNFDLWRPGFKWRINNCFVSEHHLIFCLL